MSHPLEGVMRGLNLTTASTGAGDTAVNLRPGAGKVWEVIFAAGFQDDGAVAQSWIFTDPDTASATVSGDTAGGAYENLLLGAYGAGQQPSLMAPVICTYDRYLSYHFTASAAAKNGFVRALVKEFRGVALEA